MRLLTVALFSVILYGCYAEDSFKMPVNLATEPKVIETPESHCKNRELELGGRKEKGNDKYKLDGSYCNVGGNNRGITRNGSNVLNIKKIGYCQGRVLVCEYDEKKFCKGGTKDKNYNLEQLPDNHIVFTDSNLCQLEIADHNNEAKLVNRYQQKCFDKFTTDIHDDKKILHVQTVANYRIPKREVPLNNDKLLMGDTFAFKTKRSVDCGKTCAYGSHMTFEAKEKTLFSIDFHPKKTCSWIAFCMNYHSGIGCKERNRIMLLLDQNIVLPHSMNSAITMNLRDATSIKIERDKNDKDADYQKYMTITTDTHDRIVLDAINNDKNFAVIMSDLECLAAPIYSTLGAVHTVIVDKPDDSTKLYSNPKTTGETVADETRIEQEHAINENSNIQDIKRTESAGAVTEFPDPKEEVEDIMNGTAGAVTVEVTYAPPDLGSLRQINVENGDTSTKARNSGWLTWGYFYGALAGSTLGIVIIGVLFFFARRSIYGDYYRGMYKRYGCDASGTTGGVTGADFGATTGGNTTIGATTAGATATSATTGADTTSNSAMSGTSGATSGEKTGGSTMITM